MLLLDAAENRQKEVVELLLDKLKVDVDLQDQFELTLLSWTAKNGYKEVISNWYSIWLKLKSAQRIDTDIRWRSRQLRLDIEREFSY